MYLFYCTFNPRVEEDVNLLGMLVLFGGGRGLVLDARLHPHGPDTDRRVGGSSYLCE
jgi:hypothetical protein